MMQVNLFHVYLVWIISNFRGSCVRGGNTQTKCYFLPSLLIGKTHVDV